MDDNMFNDTDREAEVRQHVRYTRQQIVALREYSKTLKIYSKCAVTVHVQGKYFF